MSALALLLLAFLLHPFHITASEIRSDDGISGAVPMKKYVIDLDQSPEERWIPILSEYNSSVQLLIDFFNEHGTKIERSLLKTILGSMDEYFGELGEEMKAIASYLGIDLGIVVTLNLSYELRRLGGGHMNTTGNSTLTTGGGGGGMSCTSIVAQDTNGTVFHGRNLDWLLSNDLRNLTVQADFLRGGEVVFTGDVTAGVVGIFTGISKKGGFSVSINERNLGGQPIEDGVEAILRHSFCPSHLLRKVLTSSLSYPDALHQLKSKPVTAPVYYITAGSGPNEGAVITRDQNTCVDTWELGSTRANQTASWFILETNYDHWKKPLPYDDRRDFGNKYMLELGQTGGASIDGLTSVLSRWPVKNNITAYTTIMVPKNFYIESSDVYY